MTTIVGIDPGVKGAVGCLKFEEDFCKATVYDLPIRLDDRKKKLLDFRAFGSLLDGLSPDLVILENVHAMFGDSGSSMFVFGRVFGSIETVLNIQKRKVHYAHPQTWKRKTRTPTEKGGALRHAQDMFPALSESLKFKYHTDRAEALLMAVYGRAFVYEEA